MAYPAPHDNDKDAKPFFSAHGDAISSCSTPRMAAKLHNEHPHHAGANIIHHPHGSVLGFLVSQLELDLN
ncbi:hypothetical protein TIFTF001_026456 [Ficus carica]|uniref:Uncharacterized protein n=1 Tax=Ficus carica TaxID=3494 RepID=A0AA88IYQ7_FICCA|nr:hypothetical protein TIFTF001_026456 [Ficus carica]